MVNEQVTDFEPIIYKHLMLYHTFISIFYLSTQ